MAFTVDVNVGFFNSTAIKKKKKEKKKSFQGGSSQFWFQLVNIDDDKAPVNSIQFNSISKYKYKILNIIS